MKQGGGCFRANEYSSREEMGALDVPDIESFSCETGEIPSPVICMQISGFTN